MFGALNFGGVESMALRLIQHLRSPEFQHVAIVLTDRPQDRSADFEKVDGLARYTCPLDTGHRAAFVRNMGQLLSSIKPDCVLAYNFGNHAWVAMAAHRAGVPRTLVRVAGSPTRDWRTRWRSTILAHLARPFCAGEIAVSHTVARELTHGLGLPRRRVAVIPNGCDVEQIEREVAAARGLAGRSSGWRILMVSRMDDAKDHGTLLRAVERLRRASRQLRLTLVGDGPLRAENERLATSLGIRDAVEFLGNRSDVSAHMAQATVVVHATHTEGMPNVLLEAMAAGVPIVASDIPPVREVLDDGRCGLLVRPRDAVKMADAIERVHDPDVAGPFVDAALRRVRAEYSISECVGRYAALLDGAVVEGE